jgi:serine/threonine protein kinase
MTDQGSDQSCPDPQRTETVLSEATPIPAHVPERIGRYHIKRVIASGGMGTVYEATQDNPRRVVAVKVMKQDSSNTRGGSNTKSNPVVCGTSVSPSMRPYSERDMACVSLPCVHPQRQTHHQVC